MQPTPKDPAITNFLERAFGRTTTGHCVPKPFGCGEPIGPFRDELSRREYTISGLCQDSIFGLTDED